MKKLVFILSAMLLLIGTMDVQAQWGKKLLKKAGESAKRATERNVERKVEQTVDKAFEGADLLGEDLREDGAFGVNAGGGTGDKIAAVNQDGAAVGGVDHDAGSVAHG